MRRTGFEPVQALSYHGLNVTRLTTPASPHVDYKHMVVKRCGADLIFLFLCKYRSSF